MIFLFFIFEKEEVNDQRPKRNKNNNDFEEFRTLQQPCLRKTPKGGSKIAIRISRHMALLSEQHIVSDQLPDSR